MRTLNPGLLGLLGLLLGCEPSTSVEDDTAADADTDTDGDTDSDSDADTDTADTGDTGDTGELPPDLAWDVSGDYDGSAFAFVSLAFSGDAFAMADILVETEAADRIEIVAPMLDDQLSQVPDVPGLYYAYALGGLHEDDGDGRWDPDETWIGVSTQIALYLDGIVPAELIDQGLHVGWNAMLLGDGGVGDPLAQQLPVLVRNELTFGGGTDGTVGDADAVSTVAATLFSGVDAPALDDTDLTADTWSLSLDGEPPDSHFTDIDGDGREEALEIFAAYTDVGGGAGLDPGVDTVVGFACHGGNLVAGWWFPSTTDLTQLLFLGSTDFSLGWNALEIPAEGGDPVFLDTATIGSLTLSASCMPPA